MSDNSRIEWTEATWNPTVGCTKVSPGCDHCYAETLHERFHGKGSFAVVQTKPDKLTLPLRWRKPRRVFVNSMSDLFHDSVPDEFIDEVFGVMAVAHVVNGHEFQLLTKRHGRLRSYMNATLRTLPGGYVGSTRQAIAGAAHRWAINRTNAGALSDAIEAGPTTSRAGWPLPGVWLGVSAENQQWADIRIPALLETPAAVRWVSAEPLLGPIDLSRYLWLTGSSSAGPFTDSTGRVRVRGGGVGGQTVTHIPAGDLHWVVVGGESGIASRPMNPEWVRSLRDECTSAGVAFFFKQWGGRTPKANGRELDGRRWDEYPTARAVLRESDEGSAS